MKRTSPAIFSIGVAHVLALVLVLADPLPARSAESNWKCGPGPSVQARAVPGGIELTYVPEDAYRVKFRAIEDQAGKGPVFESVEGAAAGYVWRVPAGHPFAQALGKDHWTRAEPYPSAGCPTPRIAVS